MSGVYKYKRPPLTQADLERCVEEMTPEAAAALKAARAKLAEQVGHYLGTGGALELLGTLVKHGLLGEAQVSPEFLERVRNE